MNIEVYGNKVGSNTTIIFCKSNELCGYKYTTLTIGSDYYGLYISFVLSSKIIADYLSKEDTFLSIEYSWIVDNNRSFNEGIKYYKQKAEDVRGLLDIAMDIKIITFINKNLAYIDSLVWKLDKNNITNIILELEQYKKTIVDNGKINVIINLLNMCLYSG